MSELPEFSVLLPVYIGDPVDFFARSLKSVSVEQTLKPAEVVVVCDGPVKPEVDEFLAEVTAGSRDDLVADVPVRVARLEQNQGLATALNFGLGECAHDVVARADADDISLPERFAVQIRMVAHGHDLVGSAVEEFESDETEPGMIRSMPVSQDEIREVVTYRDPFNHPSVVYRKSKVLEFGGYRHLERMEDYWLFARLVHDGVSCANSPKVLVKYRVGAGAYDRRGGLEMLASEWRLQKALLGEGIVTYPQFFRNLLVRGLYRLIPSNVRQALYRGVGAKRWFSNG
ncbi:glycosyltransferase [Propionimicrobium lymphophilum]|uniref:glycosyltransferase n=1 Tax=Propionimicrobium lymphophilum TaxID=33012 RepID=UPI00042393DF|nr:glycosyltransferase [Propionimicrobium lymphophilum]